MVKADINIWSNIVSLRKRLIDLSKLMLILSIMNGIYTFSTRSWLLFGFNIFYALIVLPIFFSKAKFDKEPPRIINEEIKDGNK